MRKTASLNTHVVQESVAERSSRAIRASVRREFVKMLMAKSLKGDVRSANTVLSMMWRLMDTGEGAPEIAESLHDDELDILRAFEERSRRGGDEGVTAPVDNDDDGGVSGGTLERPALERLLADIQGGKIDTVVVYKVDRLTRSLADFAKIVEVFDAHEVSFVSVTQQFNTTTSMGRLTLNMLLSFAQFEREVTGERIRDKIAASKRKGLWMGGPVPLGYEPDGRTLVINESEAEIVRTLFRLYLELGSVRRVKEEADHLGLTSKIRGSAGQRVRGGRPLSRGYIHRLLSNPSMSVASPTMETATRANTPRSSIPRRGTRFRHDSPRRLRLGLPGPGQAAPAHCGESSSTNRARP
jgi:DNA invertase Pin-like site-specific DNA recombinase